MMHTSNFWHFTGEPDDPRLVSIALWAPGWYKGRRRYPALAPRRNMLKMAEDAYRVEYQKILAQVYQNCPYRGKKWSKTMFSQGYLVDFIIVPL
jgi:hypothetical protein